MAAAIITELHGSILRRLADDQGCHFEGLQQAARCARARKRIPNSLAKKLVMLDTAYNIVRHITVPYAAKLRHELDLQLASVADTSGNDELPVRQPGSDIKTLPTRSALNGLVSRRRVTFEDVPTVFEIQVEANTDELAAASPDEELSLTGPWSPCLPCSMPALGWARIHTRFTEADSLQLVDRGCELMPVYGTVLAQCAAFDDHRDLLFDSVYLAVSENFDSVFADLLGRCCDPLQALVQQSLRRQALLMTCRYLFGDGVASKSTSTTLS
eukprot:TRINITY_DN47100_c0_g1_i4.p1 TRINITY_DN47100_c0_g1~~TRINITY_DN47100_c0_g1_i4.p1  ORF type:complete len:288 (-),score=35.13 TRINITY_DN47100_c0_g1_i4:1729-2541(-)